MGAVGWSRIQFAFTITYHYLFPQLTMGLALLLVVFKLLELRSGDAVWNDLARFCGRIFAVNFGAGVVTGIPLEFQFGTNWARFSSATGGVVGLTLAMEGVFAFFAESVFLGFFLFGEKKRSPRQGRRRGVRSRIGARRDLHSSARERHNPHRALHSLLR